MYILISDRAVVPASDSQIFSMIQQSPLSPMMTLNNDGAGVISYRFQQANAGTWTDISSLPSALNNTLSPGQTVAVVVASSYPQVRLMASAPGSPGLNFGLTRFVNRPAGGTVPILNV